MQTRRRRDPTTKTRSGRLTSSLLQRRTEALARHLPAAVAGDDTGVHQARVATRRLREAVPVLATGLKHSKAGKARRKIRRLTRALGTVRELDVTLQLIGELMQASNLPRPALEEVRRHVVEERDKRRSVMLERLEGVDVDKLRRRLSSVVEALEASSDEGWRQVLSARLVNRARRLKTAVEQAGHIYAPERLHEVRIAAKKLRYGVELAADGGVRSAAPLVARIKRVQDLLGRLHDMQILQTHIGAVQSGAGADREGMHDALAATATHVESECRHLHARYLMNVNSIQEVCETVLSRVVADTSRLRARRTLKMPLARPAVAKAAGGSR
jgi:CHAD domain-containing protein